MVDVKYLDISAPSSATLLTFCRDALSKGPPRFSGFSLRDFRNVTSENAGSATDWTLCQNTCKGMICRDVQPILLIGEDARPLLKIPTAGAERSYLGLSISLKKYHNEVGQYG